MHSDDLPWAPNTRIEIWREGVETSDSLIDELLVKTLMCRTHSRPTPLMQATTINKRAGEEMLETRKTKKNKGPEEFRCGLGVMFTDNWRNVELERSEPRRSVRSVRGT
ncbi:hypothetical protein C0991_006450 [Blastosporella zonata]|nr:hypothetical protein C0991_006450 [Blastosporella zonata]